MGLLLQFHDLIVLSLSWLVSADEAIELDEMKSLKNDMSGLEGEPLHSSARPKDIASLNIT